MEEAHRLRLASMLTANANLQAWPGGAPFFYPQLDQLPHAGLVEHDKWVILYDPLLDIKGQEFARIIEEETMMWRKVAQEAKLKFEQ